MGKSRIEVFEDLQRSQKLLEQAMSDIDIRHRKVSRDIEEMERGFEQEAINTAPGARILRALTEVRDFPTREAMDDLNALLDVVYKARVFITAIRCDHGVSMKHIIILGAYDEAIARLNL